MYSRFSGKQERVTQLPDHYSGYAFSKEGSDRREPIKKAPTQAVFEIGKPTPPPIVSRPEDPIFAPPINQPMPPAEEATRKSDDSSCITTSNESKEIDQKGEKSILSGLFGGLGNSFPFSHGIGFEELLILGLILLLAREDGDRDAILWLGLLLFCG